MRPRGAVPGAGPARPRRLASVLWWGEVGDHAAAEQAAVRVVQGPRLPRRNRPHWLGEVERQAVAQALPDAAGHGTGAVAALHEHVVTYGERGREPVHLAERDCVAEQVSSAPDHDLPGLGPYRDHIP